MPLLLILGIYAKLFYTTRKRLRKKMATTLTAIGCGSYSMTKKDGKRCDSESVNTSAEDDEEARTGGVYLGIPLKRYVAIEFPIHIAKLTAHISRPPGFVRRVRCCRCHALIRKETAVPDGQQQPTGDEGRKFAASKRPGPLLCKICAFPNDLIAAATQARLAMLVRRERRTSGIMLLTVAAFVVCIAPSGILYAVRLPEVRGVDFRHIHGRDQITRLHYTA